MNIIKRKGQTQSFDERKIYASAYAACLDAHIHHAVCEEISSRVSEKIKGWVNGRAELTSDELAEKVIEFLKEENPNAAQKYIVFRSSVH